MRFLRLDFQAFGPFAGAALDLAGDRPGLHVVYGANEAGKSSALRAVRQALFGIPKVSTDSFRHSYSDLRIGVKLQSAGGRVLEFIRRKGQKHVLFGPDDETALDAAELDRCLEGIDETAFSSQFSLDYQELRAGGDLVAQAQGHLGELLFAAAGGIRDLKRCEDELQVQARELFGKGSTSKARLNRACGEYQEALDKARQAALPTAEWTRLEAQLHTARQTQGELTARLRDWRSERDRLQRCEQAVRLIARRRQHRAELAELAGAGRLPDWFPDKYQEASRAYSLAVSSENAARGELELLDRELANLQPAALLASGGAIDDLVQRSIELGKPRRDRQSLIRDKELCEASGLRQLREVLGRQAALAEAAQLSLTPAQKVKLQELGQAAAGLAARRAAAAAQVAALQQAAAARRLDALPAAVDFSNLERCLRLAQQQSGVVQRLSDLESQVRAAQEQAQVELGRLPLWRGDLAALAALPLPEAATVDRVERALAALETEERENQKELAAQAAEAAECQRQLSELAAQHQVPSADDLAAARRRRDAGWQLVQQAWQAPPADAAALAAFLTEDRPGRQPADLAAVYADSVAEADRVADRLRHEAERVAKKASLLAAQAKASQRAVELQNQLADCRRRRGQVLAEWTAVWQPLGCQPLPPAEMRSWLASRARLCAAAGSLRTLQIQAEQLARVIGEHEQRLGAELQALGRAAPAGEGLAALVDRAASLVAELQAQQTERTAARRELDRLERELPQAEGALRDVLEAAQQHAAQWAPEMLRLGLAAEATPAQATAVVAKLDELHRSLHDAEALGKRIAHIDRDEAQLEAAARELAGRLMPEFAEAPSEEIVERLRSRLAEARDKASRRQDVQKRRDREEERRAEAAKSGREAEAVLVTLCGHARCRSFDELSAAIQRSGRLRECEAHLQTINEQLELLALGAPLEEFAAQAAEHDPAELASRRTDLEEQIQSAEQQQPDLHRQIGSLEEQLRRASGGAPATELAEQAQDLAARIEREAEQYARLQLAGAVLRTAIDRYREKNQGPVLRRAGQLFRELTLGSFQSLQTDFGDSGQLVVRGVRAGGTCGVEALSDGTRDQLYLALRLASLEHYLSAHPPCPVLVDDILIHFDDRRAAAALAALAALGEKTQVIFFTHHEHLVSLARQTLNGNVRTHELDCRWPALRERETASAIDAKHR